MATDWTCGYFLCEKGLHTVEDEHNEWEAPCPHFPHQRTCFAVNFCDETICENRHCNCGAMEVSYPVQI